MTKPKLVVLSGAGISAESGLRTFRDSDGLWEGYAIEDVATPGAWKRSPQVVLDFYNERRRNVAAASPNAAHYGLVELERKYEVSIITQNIDDLHERAGSTQVLHLHGEIFRMRSDADPSLRFDIRGDMKLGDLAPDGAQLRPDIVWFEEPVPMIQMAAMEVSNADIFLVIGTSLVVYPAAGLIHAVPPNVPVWLIDRKIPSIQARAGIHEIQMPATEGIKELLKALL
ncbi:MAG: NAD-dependent deacylase [Chitinophagaceae bacterium]|jgi:NAD-dependent deacetylase|nr:NAD-dependent deacylase [Chitinophagaceae bacterium]